MTYLSFVVDDSPKFYFQAELLIHSILKSETASKEEIIVHCTSKVENRFLHLLDQMQIKHVTIDAFLDGKYCNKIMQLDYFEKLDMDKHQGVVLLDLDTFFVEKLVLPDYSRFAGRIAGGPNPPTSVLERIYKVAEVQPPGLVSAAVRNDKEVFNNYINGGFYYIPKGHIMDINLHWKIFASWLYKNTQHFDNERQARHIDQIAMSMTLSFLKIEPLLLPNNYNLPSQTTKYIDYDKELPIYMLHYKNTVDRFGYLEYGHLKDRYLKSVMQEANEVIASIDQLFYYADYKKLQVRYQNNVLS